jgi:glycosyltransferase involved in cell wall biosynthesis
MSIKYSLVIPCFNESASLPTLISEIKLLLVNKNIEFILVDNGSTDSTSEILDDVYLENLSILKLKNNIGYGGGIKAGLDIAKGEYLGWTHADLQYSLIDSLNFINSMESNAKFIKGKRNGRALFQNLISTCMSIFESLLFRHFLNDINAQPTIFHKDLLKHFDRAPDDFSIDLYAFVMAKNLGYKVSRQNVNFINRSFGYSSWNNGLKSVFRMSIRNIKYSLKLKREL